MRDVLQWDVDSWSAVLEFWSERLRSRSGLECLEVGGREGGLSLWLALQHHHVVCSDCTDSARRAAPLHARYPVGPFITYQDVDATAIPFRERFDLIVFKSVLGAVGRLNRPDRQKQAIREMHKALRPGGLLLFAENARGSWLHGWLRRRFVAWAREWRYVSLGEMREFLQPFRSFELRTSGVLAALGLTERQRNALSSVDRAALNHMVPAQLKYIVYGIALK